MKKTMMILLAMMLPMMMMAQAKQRTASSVKVLKTEYAGMDIDQDGAYVTVNVQMQVSNIKKEEVACFALLNNSKWDGENMTVEELDELGEVMCGADVDLTPVTGTKTITVPIDVFLNAQRLTGKENSFYFKTFVVDLKKEAIITQSPMINFVPNPKESMAKKQQAINAEVIKGATRNLGPKKGGQTQGETKKVTVSCPQCSGSGKTFRYDLNRQVDCDRCGGDGKITKNQKAAGDQNVFDILSPVLGGY